MEVYILDSLFRRTEVVDKFESLLWTERFADVGDFELHLKSTLETRGQFQIGTRIAINNSYRVMTVETVEDTTDTDGKEILKVKGFSLEDILNHRVVKNTIYPESPWTIVDTPANVARTMFDHVIRNAALDHRDAIPFLQPGSIFPPGTIPENTTEILWLQNPESLHDGLKSLCDAYDLGFRLVRNFDSSQLYFDIYTGNDRTTRQTVFNPIVFSPKLENIQNTTEFQTIAGSKNVAYVLSDIGGAIVLGENVDREISGFDRRVMFVSAQLSEDDPNPNTTYIQLGNEALQQNRANAYFDGEINEYDEHKYGTDYDLGDLVELRNRDGIITYKRVTEQIFVSDSEGDRSYPTLSIDLFAGADTWISWNNKPTVWSDMTTEEWIDM